MIRDGCECEIPPRKPPRKHAKCKLIRLVNDQLRKSRHYMNDMKYNGCSMFRPVRLIYIFGTLLMLFTTLLFGTFLGAALCSKESTIHGGEFGIY